MPSIESFDTYNPKDKKHRNQELSSVESIQEQLMKPTSLIIMILICVIFGMMLQFGQIQSQISSMNTLLGKEKASESALEAKFGSMQKDVDGVKKDDSELQKKTANLENREKKLEKDDEKMRNDMNDLQKKDTDTWGQGDDFVNNQPLKDKEESAFPGSFAEFMDNIFKQVEDEPAVNESPTEKKDNGAADNFFDFPAFPKMFGPTGPVEHPHTSLNDLFQNVAKPGPHPKFANKDDSNSDDVTPPVQELKATNSKPELTEKDKASGIVSDITSHNAPVHHTFAAAPVAAPVFKAPQSETPVKIKLINPVKEALKQQVEAEKATMKINLAPKKIE